MSEALGPYARRQGAGRSCDTTMTHREKKTHREEDTGDWVVQEIKLEVPMPGS